jgi:DNA processing protein
MATYDLVYSIALTKIPLVGSIIAKTLVSYCGGFEAIFREKKKNLVRIPGIGLNIAESITNSNPESLANEELKFIEKYQVSCFNYLHNDYPKRLKNCNDGPILLYFKGNANLNPSRSLAIVGTRKPSESGKILVDKFIRELVQYDIQVISGLAYGIDALAHQSCIQKNIETIAVLGHGLDRVYPISHKKIAEKMILHGGLLTEFPINTKPDRENFPMRNRIIAGMVDAILVVESAESGGSIITAKLGNDYNRDVFAIPGRVNDSRSRGCNFLIKANLAHLVESSEDIAKIMFWDELDRKKDIQARLFENLEPHEQKIVDILKDIESMAIDQIQYRINKPSSEVSNILLQLEFKGILKSIPGKRYALI